MLWRHLAMGLRGIEVQTESENQRLAQHIDTGVEASGEGPTQRMSSSSSSSHPFARQPRPGMGEKRRESVGDSAVRPKRVRVGQGEPGAKRAYWESSSPTEFG